MNIQLHELTAVFPEYRGAVEDAITVKEVFIDSRKKADMGLFVPIEGDRFDGHDFLKDAISNGAVAGLWKKGKALPDYVPSDFPIFFAEDTTKGLQKTAEFYLEKIAPRVIAVTGSNGKTTTKDLLESVLSQKYVTHKTAGNFNNHIGLPLTILAMPDHCEVLILEMGMSGFGEIELLSKLAKPDAAIITNIGESHMEQLGSRDGIAKAKLEIAAGLANDGSLIVDGDEPLLHQYNQFPNTLTCGFEPANDYHLHSLTIEKGAISFCLNNEDNPYFIPLLGAYNVKNACYAIVVASKLGLSHSQIVTGLKTIKLSSMRLEQKQGPKQSLLINDAYNASPTSMKAAINMLKELPRYSRKVLVLGDMYELGEKEELLHKEVADEITKPITDVITIGEKGKWIHDVLKQKGAIFSIHAESLDHAVKLIHNTLSSDTAVLFKASRGMKLEQVVEAVLMTENQ